MATCYNRYTRQYYYCNRTAWSSWGRWVLLGAIILAALFVFFCLSCFTARRRRKAGRKPMYGTGWTAQPFAGGKNQTQYQSQPVQTNQYQPPTYNAPGGAANSYYGNQNQGYYGGQQTGVEMQAPPNSYRGDGGYAPPAGPPPSKIQ